MGEQYTQLGAAARAVLDHQRMIQADPDKFRPKSLGLIDCDRLLNGFDPHWYVCLGGKAKSGKTTFLLHSALVLASQQLKVLYVPLEERTKQLAIRALSRQSTTVKRADFRNLKITDEGFDEMDLYASQLEELHFVICEGVMDAGRLFTALKALPKANRPDILVADYLQLFQDRAGSMAERADMISATMMHIRNELDIGVLVSFQLGDKGKKMYGGTSVYRDADVILHLEQKKDAVSGLNMDKILQVTVMPSREVGEGMFEVTFSGAHSRITDIRPKVVDFLMDPNTTEMEPTYEPELEPVLAEAESN